MSVRFCDVSEYGFHSFGQQAGSRDPVCRHCHLSKKQLQEKSRQVGAEYLEHVKEKVTSPEGVAEIDAMRPYMERLQRFRTDVDALTNMAAYHFGNLPDPVPADVRGEVAQAVESLKAAIAGVTNPEIRESLFFAQYMAEFAIGVMEKRMADFIAKNETQQAARVPLPAEEPAGCHRKVAA